MEGRSRMTAMVEDRARAIDLAIGQIEKQFGRGAIMRLGEQHSLEIEAIPTGSLGLDLALGIGGVPRGRITEIFGPESAGKSTLAQHKIAEALVRSNAVDVIVIDSVAALVPRAEIEGEMGDSLPGLQARLMSQALR